MNPHRAAAGVAALVLPFAFALHADDRPAALVELQTAVRRAVEKVEPAVACIRVSRSTQYRQFSRTAPSDEPGQLGEFDAARAISDSRRNPEEANSPSGSTWPTRINVPEFLRLRHRHRPGRISPDQLPRPSATPRRFRPPAERLGSYADIHAADARSDLAVLRLIRPPGLTALPLGDGGQTAQGRHRHRAGQPLRGRLSATGRRACRGGVVGNVRRRVFTGTRELDYRRPLAEFGTLIQTDARLALGSSGGALVNLDGELVGLTAALAPFAGGDVTGGYAVPFDVRFRRMIGVLKAGREVEYGFIGVGLDDGNGQVHLTSVVPGSPANRAGP